MLFLGSFKWEYGKFDNGDVVFLLLCRMFVEVFKKLSFFRENS